MGVGARMPLLAAALLVAACIHIQRIPTSTAEVTPSGEATPGSATSQPTSTPDQPTSTPLEASPGPTATASPAPTLSAQPTAERAIDIELLSHAPVLEPSELPGGSYTATLPAAYFVADGTHHQYVVGFTEIPGDQRVFHATSADGLDWTVDPDDPFAELGLDMSPPGPIPGSVVRGESGQWVMYIWGAPAAQPDGAQIYRATAPEPGGPWMGDPDPVVPLGAPGDVDDLSLDFPAVVDTGEGYVMLYGANGGDSPDQARILLARSADGIEWQKAGRVLEPQLCGGTAADFTAIPRLALIDGTYLLLVVIGDDIAALTSADAVVWTCVTDGPVFTAGEIPGNDRVHSIAAAQDGHGIRILIEALVSGGSELWLAEVTGL